MNAYRQFYGYDYYELLDAWNIYVPDITNDEVEYGMCGFMELDIYYLLLFIENFIFPRLFEKEKSKFTKRAMRDIRLFLRELSKCKVSYFSNVWKCISEIEDDFSLVQFLISLTLGHAWC